MQNNEDPGDPLAEVAQIHPALDRLRNLVTSATILDLKATADGYWTDNPPPDAPDDPGEDEAG
jgi:hypothetical protein